MTFVGPRPEVPQYVELFRQDYEEILKIRPGITDLASIKYRDEAALLGQSKNPEEEYVTRVLPDKINLGKEYIRRSSVFFDLTLIFKTFLRLFDRVLAPQKIGNQSKVISRKVERAPSDRKKPVYRRERIEHRKISPMRSMTSVMRSDVFELAQTFRAVASSRFAIRVKSSSARRSRSLKRTVAATERKICN